MTYNKPEVTKLADAADAIQSGGVVKAAKPSDHQPLSDINSIAAYEADE